MIQAVVLAWIRRHDLVPPGSCIVAACSGGPDSLALVDLLHNLREELDFDLQVAHVDHGLRGEESEEDADFVRAFCLARDLPFHCCSVDVASEVAKKGGSIEEVGRRLRYDYLRKIAQQEGGAFIATGHHRDDQAETVLLNILRGSGARGLGGMRPQQGDVIHPLLCLTRSEIEEWCRGRNLHPRLDSSNMETCFRRNRIRHELLPILARNYNPSIVDTLSRTAEILADDHQFIYTHVETMYPEVVQNDANGIRMDSKRFAALDPAVQRELIRYIVQKLQGHIRGFSFLQVELIRELFLSASGNRSLDLPMGLKAIRSYGVLKLVDNLPEKSMCWNGCVALEFPGETVVPALACKIRCYIVNGPMPDFHATPGNQAFFDQSAVHPPLRVRCRRPGDRMRALGSPGERKLKDLFIDLKIPAVKRDQIPLIEDKEGILWAVGYRRSDRAKLTGDMNPYIKITVESLAIDGHA